MTKKSSFEDQLTQLEQIVQSLEKGQLPLDDALKQFEQGIKLTRICQKTLQEAQIKMEKLLNTYDIELQSPTQE
jgi:exodeoxyribonuclease VII small subunit